MDVLVVEDQTPIAGLTQRELEREYGHRVTVAHDYHEASICLKQSSFQAVVVDILYDPLLADFKRRQLKRRAIPADRNLLTSGLSVIDAVNSCQPNPGVVVWSSSDTNRRLHLLFAYEDLHVRAFCSKHSGKGTLEPLHRAIQAAGTRQNYADSILGVYLPGRNSIPLSKTLLREPTRRTFWRALALGYHSYGDIAAVTQYSEKTVRTTMGPMLDDLRLVDPGVPAKSRPQPTLVEYATDNRYFFLDDAVRAMYP